ncbi:hypothetical protein [Georgenia sp. MJ170]|uniref:hypothetical protein n=1 Tax=Georgenia sunbinii TaxID=3117728 RepID=UPI002F262354
MIDAVGLVVTELHRVLGVPVSDRVPAHRPDGRFVTVQRTGGGRWGRIGDAPELTTEAWGVTNRDAERLAHEAWDVYDALRNAQRLPGGAGSLHRLEDVGGIVSLPDDLSSRPRFTFTRRLWIRAPR